MPLSEDEQRILQEIEANLTASDPRLVQQVSETTLYRHATRAIKWAVFGFVAGLVLLVFTFTRRSLLGVRRVPGDAGLPARHRAQHPQAGQGRVREPHQLDAGRRAQGRLRRTPGAAGASAGAATRAPDDPPPPTGYTAAQAARLTGCTAAQLRSWRRSRLVDPARRAATRSGTWSRCASWSSLLDVGVCRWPASGARSGTWWSRARTSPACGSSPTATRCGRAATTARSSTRCATGSSRCSSPSTHGGRRRGRGPRVRRRAPRVRRRASDPRTSAR